MPRSTELTQRMPAILEDAKQRILSGDTLDSIAISNGITKPTLWTWLSGMGEEYSELRKLWIDAMLAESHQAIVDVPMAVSVEDARINTFNLTHARTRWDCATWYAERRDKRYQIKQEQQSTVVPTFVIVLDPGGVNVHRQGQGSIGGDIYASPQIPSSVDTVLNIENGSDTKDSSGVEPPSCNTGE